MKRDERGAIAELTAEELADKLLELKQTLFNLRFQHSVNKLENTSRLKAVKKEIARVKTYQRQLELSASAE
ncbi:MAG: 50S ribosomal protein L29 [Oscillospiraceae bacterium]|jgi:large subunit ribosomal protein L29|nr:50S ribosomal protein L29 [Oscillospiraceae bacterium]